MLGLYGGAWLALLAVCALALWAGRGLPLLVNSGGYGAWLYLGCWMVLGLPLMAVSRADRGWRAVLVGSGAGFVLIGTLVVRRAGFDKGMLLLAFGALAVVCLLAAPLMDARRVRKRRPVRERSVHASRAPRPDLRLGWCAWTLGLLSSFWCAWKGTNADLRGAGSAMLLATIFLALPALCAGSWRRQGAALGLALSALACASVYRPDMLQATAMIALVFAALGFAIGARRGRRACERKSC